MIDLLWIGACFMVVALIEAVQAARYWHKRARYFRDLWERSLAIEAERREWHQTHSSLN